MPSVEEVYVLVDESDDWYRLVGVYRTVAAAQGAAWAEAREAVREPGQPFAMAEFGGAWIEDGPVPEPGPEPVVLMRCHSPVSGGEYVIYRSWVEE